MIRLTSFVLLLVSGLISQYNLFVEAGNCNKDIKCLTKNSQITFIGKVIETDEVYNKSKFNVTVSPLCIYNVRNNENFAFDANEYSSYIKISGFGTHAGGSCNGDSGIVGDINIFYAHVSNTVTLGGKREYGLSDPCYGAFLNNTQNYLDLIQITYGELNYTPTGNSCAVVSKNDTHITIDGETFNKTTNFLDDDNNDFSDPDSSIQLKAMTLGSLFIISLFTLFLF